MPQVSASPKLWFAHCTWTHWPRELLFWSLDSFHNPPGQPTLSSKPSLPQAFGTILAHISLLTLLDHIIWPFGLGFRGSIRPSLIVRTASYISPPSMQFHRACLATEGHLAMLRREPKELLPIAIEETILSLVLSGRGQESPSLIQLIQCLEISQFIFPFPESPGPSNLPNLQREPRAETALARLSLSNKGLILFLTISWRLRPIWILHFTVSPSI